MNQSVREVKDNNTDLKTERRLHRRFYKAIADYRLIEDGDKILIGLSGGKDSLCLVELLGKKKRINHPSFEVEAVHVRMENIHYESDTTYLSDFCRSWDIPLHVVTTAFDLSTDKRKSPCFLCSWNRRKQMFNLAQEQHFNKIALGHHMDDILHTTLMNQFFQGHFSTMPVRLKMRKMPLTIIRPLCLEAEADIRHYAEMKGYVGQKKTCLYEKDSYRSAIKHIFEEAERLNPDVRHSIWNALESDNKLIEDENEAGSV